jgi:hypothetical protein
MPSTPNGNPSTAPYWAHQARPQQAHLERQHRAGHRADRDQHPHRLRPAPRQPHRDLVPPPQAGELGQQHGRRQRNPQAGQDDVKPQRGRHLCPSRNHLTADVRNGKHNRAIKMHYSSLEVCGRHRWG